MSDRAGSSPGRAPTPKLMLGHRERGIAVALILSLLLWQLPAGGLVLYPFKLLATWIHETSHGIAMALSGAGFDSLEIYRDTSGIAYAAGGTGTVGRAAIAAAGYMGAPLFGAILLFLAQRERGCRVALAATGAVMALTAAIWINGDFGLWVGYGGAALFIAAAAALPERWASWALSFVGAQACINAVLDIRVLFRPQLVINGQPVRASDANKMAEAVGGSATAWAAVWLVWSFVAFLIALRLVYLRERADERRASDSSRSRSKS